MRIPTIHLNGTSARELREQLAVAVEAIVMAQTKLALAMPHGRDYYVQDRYPPHTDAINEAQREMRARIDKLEQVKDELVTIHQGIMDQERERRR